MSLTPVAALVSGVVLLVLWVVLAFVVAIPAGWIHLALALGISLIAAAIVLTEPGADRSSSRLDKRVK